jgi:hypothetical protein
MTAAGPKEIRSLLATLVTVRILKCIADERLDDLRATDTISDPLLNLSLRRLRRRGLIKAKGSQHSLTPAGRKALKLAVSGLKQLAALTDRRA